MPNKNNINIASLAKLVRINLNPQDTQELISDLHHTIKFINKLTTTDVAHTNPTASVLDFGQYLRDDKITQLSLLSTASNN